MKKLQKSGRLLTFLPLALTVLFCMLPNRMPGIPQASDEPFHLARIQSLTDGLRAGIFPVKVHPQLCYGLGYGVGFFYDNALLYFPAILVLLGLSLELSYKIFIFCLFIVIGAGMYVAVFISPVGRILPSSAPACTCSPPGLWDSSTWTSRSGTSAVPRLHRLPLQGPISG